MRKLGNTNSVNLIRFSNFTQNPKLPDVLDGLNIYRKSKATLILAVGGGTAIDIAKLIKHYSETDLRDEEDFPPRKTVCNTLCELIAIPTTFGTGSESTHFAVLYVNERKHSVSDNSMLPEFYLLDASLGNSLPLTSKASTCLDALCQAIESFWSVNSNEESRKYAYNAIKIISKNIRAYFDSPLNSSSLTMHIAAAANLSGKAINISKTTAPHALSYSLTSKFGIPHGHAVALCTRKMFRVMENYSNQNDIADLLMSLYNMLEVKDAKEAEELFNEYMVLGSLETDLTKLGVGSYRDIEFIIGSVNKERLKNHPVRLTHNDLTSLF